MEVVLKGYEEDLREALANFFQQLGDEDDGIDARWYRANSCQNETVTQAGDAPAIANLIPPVSTLFRLSKERSNKLLLACGLLEKIKKGANKGMMGIVRNKWESLKAEFQLNIEFDFVTKANSIGRRVWCIRVGSFRGGPRYNAGTQAQRTKDGNWNPKRIRNLSQLNELFYSVAFNLSAFLATGEANNEESDDEENAEAATAPILRSTPRKCCSTPRKN
jgi:hypothetical protein